MAIWHQAIIWTSARALGKSQWNFNQNTKLVLNENASEKSRPFCPGGDELTHSGLVMPYGHIDKG